MQSCCYLLSVSLCINVSDGSCWFLKVDATLTHLLYIRGVVLISFIDLNSFPIGSPNETVLGISLTAKFSDSNHVLVGWTENSTQVSTCVYPRVYLQRDVCLYIKVWKLLILCLYSKKLMVISMIDSLLAADWVIPCRV